MAGTALQNDVRRKILALLREGELTAGAISEALDRARPGISHHLSCLLDEGLVTCRVDGAHRLYSLRADNALAAWDAYVNAHTVPS